MKIIDDIIDLLADEKSSTQSALLKAQILAHRLGDQELGSWVENELRGYPEGAEVPPYRVLGLTLVGHVTNGVYHHSNQTLPTGHLKEPLKTNLTQARARDSVSAIESWTDKDNIAKPKFAVRSAFSRSPRRLRRAKESHMGGVQVETGPRSCSGTPSISGHVSRGSRACRESCHVCPRRGLCLMGASPYGGASQLLGTIHGWGSRVSCSGIGNEEGTFYARCLSGRVWRSGHSAVNSQRSVACVTERSATDLTPPTPR